MDIMQSGPARKPAQANARVMPAARAQLAERLAAIRCEIRAVISAPGCFGGGAAQRRRRDEDILLTIAADLNARVIEARSA